MSEDDNIIPFPNSADEVEQYVDRQKFKVNLALASVGAQKEADTLLVPIELAKKRQNVICSMADLADYDLEAAIDMIWNLQVWVMDATVDVDDEAT